MSATNHGENARPFGGLSHQASGSTNCRLGLHLRDVVEPPVFRGNEQFAMLCTDVHERSTGSAWRKVPAALRTVQE